MTLVKWIRQRMAARQSRRAACLSRLPKRKENAERPPDPPRPDFAHRRHQPIVRRSVLPLVCLALAVAPRGGAATPEDTFNEANRAFAQQHFAEAARGYERVIAQDGYSAPVLFDLANAYAREGKWGLAILNYQRARFLAPRDPDIAANLKFAWDKAGLTAPPARWYAKGVQAFSPNAWAWIGSLSLLVACAGLLADRLHPARRLAFRWLTVLGVITLFAAIGADIFWWQEGRRAVVVDKNAPLRVAPATVAESSGSLPEGDHVRIQETHGHFALVRDAAGHRGWVSTNQIAQVMTTHRNSRRVL